MNAAGIRGIIFEIALGACLVMAVYKFLFN
jgi:hypothetical protein